MELLKQLQQAIEEGHPGETVRLTQQAIKDGIDPMKIVEEAMMPAMNNVGERYKTQDADIIRILAAARSIRKGFDLIEEKGISLQKESLGTIILGTVEGDLHDVGKNLVALMFRSTGFKVIDLGVDISEKQFLRAVKQTPDVSIVCVSSLLSTALPEMEQIVHALRKNDPHHRYQIMVGGGAVTRELAARIGADAYTENCVEAAEVANSFLKGERRP
jgi:5-methyltetrahydrofolate--homocysteine methyltransferase